jgi:FdhD protein
MREIETIPVTKLSEGGIRPASDDILVEEPLEIYVNGLFYALTMRLAGDEIALATGLCFTDGIIQSVDDLQMVHYCGEDNGNRIDLQVKGNPEKEDLVVRRRQHTSYSSCGICGSELVGNAIATIKKVEKDARASYGQILKCQHVVQEMQTVFKATGCPHGAGIFDAEARLLSFSEDVGRHNALDKSVGKLLLSRTADEAVIVILTSRISYEMVLKAGRLGAPIIAGPSAVTSLAVELASSVNLTLIGFLRDGRGNIYNAPERIT